MEKIYAYVYMKALHGERERVRRDKKLHNFNLLNCYCVEEKWEGKTEGNAMTMAWYDQHSHRRWHSCHFAKFLRHAFY